MSVRLVIEAIVVGISTLVIGLLLHVILGYHAHHAHSPTMKKEMIQLSILLFLTGASIHLLYEVTNMNKWYCKNGNAVKG
jgi:hypothetical protein